MACGEPSVSVHREIGTHRSEGEKTVPQVGFELICCDALLDDVPSGYQGGGLELQHRRHNGYRRKGAACTCTRAVRISLISCSNSGIVSADTVISGSDDLLSGGSVNSSPLKLRTHV